MVGFFLPGDSLLFVAGIYSDKADRQHDERAGPAAICWIWWCLGHWCRSAASSGTGWGIGSGYKSGPFLYHRKDNFLFKKKYLFRAKEFYEKHGGEAIVFARFLPIIRTFTPIIAGIVAMDRKKFVLYNIIGCTAWVFAMLFAGHYLRTISVW